MHESSKLMIHLMVTLLCMANIITHAPCAVSEVTVISITAVTPGDC